MQSMSEWIKTTNSPYSVKDDNKLRVQIKFINVNRRLIPHYKFTEVRFMRFAISLFLLHVCSSRSSSLIYFRLTPLPLDRWKMGKVPYNGQRLVITIICFPLSLTALSFFSFTCLSSHFLPRPLTFYRTLLLNISHHRSLLLYLFILFLFYLLGRTFCFLSFNKNLY